jgi:nucleolar protein 15
MNNYILFDKILKCSTVDDTSRYALIFKKWKRKFKFNNTYQNYLQEKNKFKTKEEAKEHVKLLLEKEEVKRKKLSELGIKYDFPGFVRIFFKKIYFFFFLILY